MYVQFINTIIYLTYIITQKGQKKKKNGKSKLFYTRISIITQIITFRRIILLIKI